MPRWNGEKKEEVTAFSAKSVGTTLAFRGDVLQIDALHMPKGTSSFYILLHLEPRE